MLQQSNSETHTSQIMADDYKYFENKREDKVYVSRMIPSKIPFKDSEGEVRELIKPLRIVSKIVPCQEGHAFIKQGSELILRITPGGKQEIVAKIYEDTRGITTLTIQKYTTSSGVPHKAYFTFVGEEIFKLVNFIVNIPFLPISGEGTQQFTDDFLKKHILNKEQALKLLSTYPDILSELLESNITNYDIAILSSRKRSLEQFKQYLENENISEAEWQAFFEANTWIFGYGLNYVFNSPLEGKKLEQVVAGHTFNESGKRIDALLARRGMINTLCMVEIKKHTTPLLGKEYRPSCYPASSELSGGVSQVQKTIQKSLNNIRTELKDADHNPTGEVIFNYQPKSYLIIGSLSEFTTDKGINEEKLSSYELFRKNISNPEIITYDELFERAKFIVANVNTSTSEEGDKPENQKPTMERNIQVDSTPEPVFAEVDDLPF